jgi:hypothetical protein
MITKIESEDDWKAASVRLDQLHRACELTPQEAEECESLMTMMSAWDAMDEIPTDDLYAICEALECGNDDALEVARNLLEKWSITQDQAISEMLRRFLSHLVPPILPST